MKNDLPDESMTILIPGERAEPEKCKRVVRLTVTWATWWSGGMGVAGVEGTAPRDTLSCRCIVLGGALVTNSCCHTSRFARRDWEVRRGILSLIPRSLFFFIVVAEIHRQDSVVQTTRVVSCCAHERQLKLLIHHRTHYYRWENLFVRGGFLMILQSVRSCQKKWTIVSAWFRWSYTVFLRLDAPALNIMLKIN